MCITIIKKRLLYLQYEPKVNEAENGGNLNWFMVTNALILLLYFTGLATTFVANAVEKEGDDPLDWLRDSIPGEPGVDYPIFSAVEQTSFDCGDKVFGGKSHQ